MGRSCSNLANLCHDDDLLAREIVLFDSLSEDDLRDAVGIHVRGVEGLNPRVIAALPPSEFSTVSIVELTSKVRTRI